MCRGFQQSESERFLKMKAFYLTFSIAHKSCVTTFPDSLTLHYLPRINGTHLEINHSKIKPDSPAFLTLHRVMSPPSDGKVCFASREKVKASQGARFEVFFGDIRVLKGFFRKDWDDTWKMECSCGLECSSGGRILQEIVKKAEVSVVAEGDVVMNEIVEIVAKTRRRRSLKGGALEEIPEETEYCDFSDSDSCSSSSCCCCEEVVESESESCGDQDCCEKAAAEEEMEGEGSWAVDVGIWVMCLGVGLLVSRASSNRLLRRTAAFL